MMIGARQWQMWIPIWNPYIDYRSDYNFHTINQPAKTADASYLRINCLLLDWQKAKEIVLPTTKGGRTLRHGLAQFRVTRDWIFRIATQRDANWFNQIWFLFFKCIYIKYQFE